MELRLQISEGKVVMFGLKFRDESAVQDRTYSAAFLSRILLLLQLYTSAVFHLIHYRKFIKRCEYPNVM